MRDLDDTDREILRLLLEDARRPWADVAEHVDLSAPAVSDRVARLRELGVVRGFTLDLDRSRLGEGVEVLVRLTPRPGSTADVRDAVGRLEGVEHVFRTAEGAVVFTAVAPGADVERYLAHEVDLDAVDGYEVSLLADAEWHPQVEDATLGLECAECGNTVTSEGATSTLGGDRYEFCCTSCQGRFEERYERMAEGA
jgi:DNA-binding Lrp family transcriptional regulator